MSRRWRVRPERGEQVANGPAFASAGDPVSDAPAQAVRAAWAPVLSGQPIPKLGERRFALREVDSWSRS